MLQNNYIIRGIKSMEDIKKLAEDYYNFILKYDECFFKKYKEKEAEKDEKALKIKT